MIRLIKEELYKIFKRKEIYVYIIISLAILGLMIYISNFHNKNKNMFNGFIYKTLVYQCRTEKDKTLEDLDVLIRSKNYQKYSLNPLAKVIVTYKHQEMEEVFKEKCSFDKNNPKVQEIQKYFDDVFLSPDKIIQELIRIKYPYAIEMKSIIDKYKLDISDNKVAENLDIYVSLKNNRNSKEDRLYKKVKVSIENNYNNQKTENIHEYISIIKTVLGISSLFVIIMSANTLTSEHNKFTIKYLLTKPFTRNKIVISKYLSMIILYIGFLLLFGVLALLMSFMLGLDFNAIQYSYNDITKTFVTLNGYELLLINILDMILYTSLLTSIAFFIGVLTLHNSLSIILSILFTMFLSLFTKISNKYLPEFLIKILPFNNIEISNIVIGVNKILGIPNVLGAILLTISYCVLGLVISILLYRKRDIKNI